MNEQAPEKKARSRRALLRWLLLGAVLVVSIWLVVRSVDWSRLGEAMLALHWLWVVGGVVTTFGAHLARAARWRHLIPDGREISLLNAFSATIIGYLLNNLIPRSGELARPWILARREERPTGTLIATIVVERILDGITLLLLLGILLLLVSDRIAPLFPDTPPRTIALAVALPLIAAVILLVVVARTSVGERAMGWVEDRLPGKLGQRLRGRLRRFVADFRGGISVGGGGGIVAILFWTGLIWLGYALAVWCGFHAFDLATTYDLGLDDAFLVLGITAIGISIAPTPGAFGVYHFFSRLALVEIYHVPVELAVAFGLVTHAAPYLAVMGCGFIFLLRENISLREVQTPSPHS